ncbi:hypothetical protein D9611_000045 [Ephemerocybe angulata]|uniref:Uncharacterized protein n=2 Tax=Ephemerocybe angulata TaxID=980116 RepID=A0A8H6I796_9AGAR|nr:hypothetical protein D9611_000045 [Tulosesus angulatus]KAF6760136.1 hypothetical protein DFP72DRAFT_97449 [Tulosesus angulatus]
MSYSLSNNYLPPPQPSSGYYSQPTSHLPSLPPLSSNSQRPPADLSQRKRPKYTRSKTGCLTCRVKKVKCDESKPVCVRCSHGQRDCTWPEGVQTRKKPSSRKDSLEGDARPSTAGSSGLSEGSTPSSTREHSPPRRSVDLCFLPAPSRRPVDSYGYSQSFKQEPDMGRPSIQMNPERASPYIYPSPSPDAMPAIHEPYQSRYDNTYSNANASHHPRPTMPAPYRSYTHHEPVHHWHAPPVDSPYYHHPVPERPLLSPSASSNDSHHRYQ